MPTPALLRLALAPAHAPQALNLAGMAQLVGSLCKRHAVAGIPAPTACRRTVSGSISLPCPGCFPPFPHGTGPLSVFREYLALRDGPRGFRQDSSCPAVLRYPPLHSRIAPTGVSPAPPGLPRPFGFSCCRYAGGPTTPGVPRHAGFGLRPFRSPLLRTSIFLSFPAGTEMFQFPAFAPAQAGVRPPA